MKKIGDLMKEMGFNKDAPDSAKEAFIKHLIKAATGHDVITPTEKQIIRENPDKIVQFPKQLVFNFDDADLLDETIKYEKSKKA